MQIIETLYQAAMQAHLLCLETDYAQKNRVSWGKIEFLSNRSKEPTNTLCLIFQVCESHVRRLPELPNPSRPHRHVYQPRPAK